MSGVSFRPAESDDACAIIDLATRGFAEERRALFVYACTGAEAFVRGHIALPPALAERRYAIAEGATGDVIGVVDLVRAAHVLHLAYIAVAPAARGLRLAPQLLQYALQHCSAPASTLQLDVFTDNERAARWYDRLGFETTSETAWFRAEPRPASDTRGSSAYVTGLPAADAVHARFGFSQFTVQTPSAGYTVGRIGERWFRLTDAAALDDPDVRAALHSLDPQRGLLVLAPAESNVGERGFVRIATSHRRRTSLAALISRLEQTA